MFFDDDYEEVETSDRIERDSSGIFFKILLFILLIIASPSIILGGIHYFVCFKSFRFKPRFSSLIALGELLLVTLVAFITSFFVDKTYIYYYIVICSYLGVVGGQLFLYYRNYQLKHYPEIKVLPGWGYKFEYEEDIFDKKKRNKLIKECKNGELASEEAAPLGILDAPMTMDDGEEFESIEPVYSYYEEALKTRLITGLTGSGKTITMLNLIKNDMRAGYPMCVIDFKKGVDLAYFLSKFAKEHKRPFYHFVSGPAGSYKNPFCSHQASYDPLSSGSSTSKADMVLNMREWDSASDVYKGRTQSILQAIFYLLSVVDKNELPKIPWSQGGLAQLIAALKTENLMDMISWLEKDMSLRETTQGDRNRLAELQSLYRELTSSTRSPLREQIEGIATICRILMMSSYSDWLAAGETPYHIDLTKLVMSKKKPVILFQFNPNEEQEFAKYLGNIILSDLARASAEKQRRGDKSLFGLYIDEAQALNVDKIIQLFEKSRSAGFYSTISVQSSNQISKEAVKNSEDTLFALFDTINTFIIHQGSTEKTAQMLSQIVSKVDKEKYRVTGHRNSSWFASNRKLSRQSMVSTVIEEEYKVAPSEFQSLSAPNAKNGYKSQAFYITKSTSDPEFADQIKPVARKVWIIPDEEVVSPIPQKFIKNFENTNIVKRRRPIDDSILQDNNFKIEKIDTNERARESTQDMLNYTLNESYISQKEFNKVNKRENLEKPTKETSFDKLVNNKKKSDINIEKRLPGQLPKLPEL